MRTAERLSHVDLVMHDVRLRILHATATEAMTPKALAERMPDVPQATLYRHLKILLDHDAIESIGERAVRGVVEHTYRAKPGMGKLTREEFATLPAEEHRRIFALWLGELRTVFESYFSRDNYDTTQDGMTYFMLNLPLDDEHRRQFRIDLLELCRSYTNEHDPGRRTLVGVALIPAAEEI